MAFKARLYFLGNGRVMRCCTSSSEDTFFNDPIGINLSHLENSHFIKYSAS